MLKIEFIKKSFQILILDVRLLHNTTQHNTTQHNTTQHKLEKFKKSECFQSYITFH